MLSLLFFTFEIVRTFYDPVPPSSLLVQPASELVQPERDDFLRGQRLTKNYKQSYIKLRRGKSPSNREIETENLEHRERQERTSESDTERSSNQKTNLKEILQADMHRRSYPRSPAIPECVHGQVRTDQANHPTPIGYVRAGYGSIASYTLPIQTTSLS